MMGLDQLDGRLAINTIASETPNDFIRLKLMSELAQSLRLADSSGFDIVAVHISQALDLLRQHLGSTSSTAPSTL
ncbi:MAG: hypothetical protein ACO1OX_02015 [Novosphingobium sp.]